MSGKTSTASIQSIGFTVTAIPFRFSERLISIACDLWVRNVRFTGTFIPPAIRQPPPRSHLLDHHVCNLQRWKVSEIEIIFICYLPPISSLILLLPITFLVQGFFGVLLEAQRIFLGLDFWLHSIIPVTWNPEHPTWCWNWVNLCWFKLTRRGFHMTEPFDHMSCWKYNHTEPKFTH